jgi:hypothetical protein
MWGNSAQIELFANLLRIAAFLVLLHLIASHPLGTQGAATWKFVFVGLLSAAAFLFKAIYLSPLLLAGFILLLECWQKRSIVGAWPATLLRGGWIGLGFAAGLSIVVAYFGLLGLWPRVLLIFTLGQGYTDTSTVGWQYTLFYPLVGLGYNNVALLIFSLVGLIIILTNKTQRTPALLYVAVWYILSFVEAGSLVRVFRFYYYLLIVPPLALLAAWFLLKIYRDVRQTVRPAQAWRAPLILGVLLTISLAISIAQNFNFYAHYFRYKLGQATHQEFFRSWPTISGRALSQAIKSIIGLKTFSSIIWPTGAVQLI